MPPVSQEEVVQLLTKYWEMTRDRIDRVMFRDLLHDHFDMSDDFFMDRGEVPVIHLLLQWIMCVCVFSVPGIRQRQRQFPNSGGVGERNVHLPQRIPG